LRRQRLDSARLYFVCEPDPAGAELEPLLRAALNGGARLIQLRDKDGRREVSRHAAFTFRRLADTYGALFIVNDDPGFAIELGADGVHIGQDDADPGEARHVLGPEAIIGLSTHSEAQIDDAQGAGVDYISDGPVWETPTKPGRPAVGLELVRYAAANSAIPFFAIGGIDPGNAAGVVEAGATRMVVVRAIRDAGDPMLVATTLSDLLPSGR
jgi:thiamine-phosphate pyrophosphorylase